MALLAARGIRVAFGGQDVLHGVDLAVDADTTLGLAGPNGAGKSTLLRVLAGLLEPDAGDVVTTGTVGLLPQEPERLTGEDLAGYLRRRTGVAEAEAALDAAAAALAAPPTPGCSPAEHDSALARAAEDHDAALQRWMALGGADLDDRAAAVLADLGLDEAALSRPTAVLSGGEMARGALASVLLSRFDVLLLDEPTNDLDLAGLDVLERFVQTRRGTGIVLVSHDREFLARTVTDVLELDPVNRTQAAFAGGWEAYRREREIARQRMREAWDAGEAKRADLVGQVQGAKERSVRGALRARKQPPDPDKVGRSARIEAATKGAQKVRALESRLTHLDRQLEADGIAEPRKEWELRLHLPAAPRSGDVVATLRDAVVRRGDFVLGPVTLDLARGDRVAVLGANGSGKSTLLQVLLGHRQPDEGTATLGSGVVVGELDQARGWLQTDRTVVELLAERSGLEATEARTLLAKFGLRGPRAGRPAAALSPGERTRALLALLMAVGTNLLVLDEPTNHLDLPAVEQLEQALEAYEGTLLLVSHDRRLLQAVRTTHTWTLDAGRLEARGTSSR